jgi:glycosyltransferase involved in cell wall biosynthesis
MVGLLSEAADNRGICGLARKAQYSLDRHLFGRNVDFILAMGEQGARWFHSAGYDSSRIFPFGYVTERPVVTSENRMKAGERETFRILYLGQIVARKAGVTAIRALAQLSSLDWRFDVVGDGPDLPRWKTAALESGIAERVRFRPPVDNSILGSVLQEVDLLLLPSRFDGWGAVVNESLMSGIPVVCSDRCGAAGLLREACRGTIFKAGSVNSLREELQRWIERGKRTAETTARIREWSSVLEGPQLAQYLLQIIEYLRNGGHRPSPAWC